MGSISDMPVMQDAIDILKEFGIETEVDIVSAHRTPEKLFDFSKNAHIRGISVVIAGAGGAAHLPGMVASNVATSCNWSSSKIEVILLMDGILFYQFCKCLVEFL